MSPVDLRLSPVLFVGTTVRSSGDVSPVEFPAHPGENLTRFAVQLDRGPFFILAVRMYGYPRSIVHKNETTAPPFPNGRE